MKRSEAEQIVRECIAEKYDRSKFSRLIANIFHSGLAPTTGNVTVLPAYESHVRACTKIGTAKTADNRTTPIYEVVFKGDGSVQNARRKQRDFIASLVEAGQADGALVAFVSEKESDAAWRFSFVTVESRLVQKNGKNVIEKEKTPAKRWSFMVGKEERTHTPLSRFVPIVESETVPKFEDVEHAFDVEAVTKEFFNQYKELFLRLKETMDGLFDKDEALKSHFEALGISSADFAKKTLGQIVFLYFLQKKGWFGVTKSAAWGSGPKDFLRLAFVRHAEGKFGKSNFFNDVLEPLFYEGLSKDRSSNGQLYDFWNGSEYKIPYLNGGLFEPIAGYDWQATSIPIPDDFFSNSKARASDGTGVLDIFDLYNFTVNEEEPLEKEVAIDPEMLGKIFENLLEVTDRKSKGAFYTPRPIVHYMCEESLIEYLKTSTKVNEEGIRSLIRQKNLKWDSESDEDFKQRPTGEQEAIRNIVRTIDQKLGEVKIFDPAIGSGAFPMWLLHEIVSIRRYFREHGWIDFKENAPNATKDNYAYELKRLAIENSLYGSDIDPGAITVAKLRCWLSLLIDAEEPHPLPNLDFKFVCANTLIPLRIRDSLQSQLSTTLQEQMRIFVEFDQKRIAYFGANEERKNVLKSELKTLQARLRNLLEQGAQMDDISSEYRDEVMKFVTWDVFWNGSAPFFNQRLMYGIKDGFDIVIGNPPYVQTKKWEVSAIDYPYSEWKDKGKQNLYKVFTERAYQLAKPGTWIASYILQSSLLCDISAEFTRELLLRKTEILKIIEFPKTTDGKKVFDSVLQWTCIFVIRMTSDNPDNEFLLSTGNSVASLTNISWTIIRQDSIEELYPNGRFIPLVKPGEFGLIQKIFSGRPVLGDMIADSAKWDFNLWTDKDRILQEATPIKMYRWKNVHRYFFDANSEEYLEEGFKYKAVELNYKFDYLLNQQITGTTDKYRLHFCISKHWKKRLFWDSVHKLRLKDESKTTIVLALLNSNLLDWIFRLTSTNNNVNGYEIEALPMPHLEGISSQDEIKKIEFLTDQIISLKHTDPTVDTSALESQIDTLVYQLYDLTPEEIAIIEGA